MIDQKKPQQNQPERRKTTAELIHDFCQDLEKGDLGMNRLIEYGYLLYGQTRSGKTAASHLLSGNALKGIKIAGEEKVENSTSKNKNAKIGNTPVSQTRVPNLFEIKHPNGSTEKVHVIDTPGYGDTNGTFRILGNGYYHYKLYSKVQNMKFILCFDQIQLQNTAQLFIDTIVQFTSYFKDYEDHKEQIWESCVFLINKVDENVFSLDDLKTKMREIQKSIKIQKKQQEIDLIKKFINYIVENDRVFTIKKYKLGDSATRADLLKAIDEKSKWWSRLLNEKNENQVDMQPILFNITKPILVELTKNELSKVQFVQLVEYYNARIREILQPQIQDKTNKFSLDYVFNELVKDAMGEPDSHGFLDSMQSYIDKYYHIYDQNYREPREKLQKELFQSNNASLSTNQTMSGRTKIKEKNFIVKKFQVLQKIEDLKFQMNDKAFSDQDYKILSQSQRNKLMKSAIDVMIKEFNKVSYKRKYCTEIIYKYGYMIHRLISEVHVMLLLMGNASNDGNESLIGKNKIREAANNVFLSLKPMASFMGLPYKYQGIELSLEALKSKFIKEIDLNNELFSKVTINWPLIQLFSSAELNDEDSQIVVQKVIVLLEKFSEQFLAQKQTKVQNYSDTVKLIQKLVTARDNCTQLIELTQDQQRKDYFTFIIRRITNNIGKLLENIKKYSIAREVYKSIYSIHSVCQLYQEEIKSLANPDKDEKGKKINPKDNKPLKLRIEYSTFCREHCRIQEAISILQEAFEQCSNKHQLQEVKSLLSDALLQTGGRRDNNTQYEKNLFSNLFFKPFDQKLQEKIQNLTPEKITQSEISTKWPNEH